MKKLVIAIVMMGAASGAYAVDFEALAVNAADLKAAAALEGIAINEEKVPGTFLIYSKQWWPSPKAMKNVRAIVHDLTDVMGNRAKDVKEVVAALNPVVRGWGNYFRFGNADREFGRLDN